MPSTPVHKVTQFGPTLAGRYLNTKQAARNKITENKCPEVGSWDLGIAREDPSASRKKISGQ
jgi:hypothetical protein